jgi:rhamnulokinase
MKKGFLAIDLGATSGRALIGIIENGKLETVEIHRFSNEFVPVNGHLFWNIYRLFSEVLKSIQLAVKNGYKPISIGIDTWGVDFCLVGTDGFINGLPFAYRDHISDGMVERFTTDVFNAETLYHTTGIQIMQINSLFQLYGQKKAGLSSYNNAATLLFIPDALNYLLTGNIHSEYTIASTSSLLNAETRNWDDVLIKKAGIKRGLFADIIFPGNKWGMLTRHLSDLTGIQPMPIIAVASHDTASAVAAIPAKDTHWAFLSLGTWSLMGIETQHPILTKEAFEHNFTNEGGLNGTIRFLKNMTGFWLIEQCMKDWDREGEKITYSDIDKSVIACKAFQYYIDTEDKAFTSPANMIDAMKEYMVRTGQGNPATPAEWALCIFESLVIQYRRNFEILKTLSPFPIEQLHIIGGGTKNVFLCQMIANALGITVIAGPSEATSAGNLLMQAYAMNEIQSFSEIRDIMNRGNYTTTYYPVKEIEKKFACFERDFMN